MTAMRIMHVITKGEAGGAQTHVASLLRHHGPDCALVVGSEGPLTDLAARLSVDIHVVRSLSNSMNALEDLAALLAIRRAIISFQPDIVHCHSSKAGFLGRLAAHKEGVPAIFTAHGWGFSAGVPIARKALVMGAERLAAQWSRALISVSQYDLFLAQQMGIGRPAQHFLVRNAIQDCNLRSDPGVAAVPRLAMVARFDKPKEQHTLLRTLAQVTEPWTLALVGDGPALTEVRRLAGSLRISERVEFTGNIKDVPGLLARCHLFCLISSYEGLPMSIIEAMRSGLPIIASDVGGVRELVHDGDNGYGVPRHDVATLARRLRTLICDRSARARMGARSREVYEAGFTITRLLNEIDAVYRHALVTVR